MTDDDYTFIKELGSGSFGTTWLAKNKETKAKVAIKIFGTGKMDKKEANSAKEDWVHEIKMLSFLLKECFPYAVCVVDSYIEDEQPRLVMDFVDGPSLEDQMDKWPRKKANGFMLMEDLIKGVQMIHKHGVVHEDIKGENVIWDKNMVQYRFIDFGLSCRYKTPKVNLKKVKFPCGTYGTKYIASPDMEALRKSNPIVPWKILQAHDYWDIGIQVLRWFTYPADEGYYLKEYKKWAASAGKTVSKAIIEQLGLNRYAPYFYLLPPEFLDCEMAKIKDDEVRYVVALLLEYDGYKRWENFKEVVKLF